MNPASMYPYGGQRPAAKSSTDQAEATLAAAQLLANDRNLGPSQRELPYASGAVALNPPQMHPQFFSQPNPALAGLNPFLPQAPLPPPAVAGQGLLPQFQPQGVADSQALLRAQAAAAVLLQQQQEAAQLQAMKHARMFAEANRVAGLTKTNSLETRGATGTFANTASYGTGLTGSGLSNIPPALLRTLENSGTNEEGADSKLGEATAIRTAKMEEDALEFLGSTTREAKNGLYFDASILHDPEPASLFSGRRTRGGVTEPFPEKVHRMLSDAAKEGNESILSWFPHGRAFAIHEQDQFVKVILPRYVKQSQMSSFQRQLNLYGFLRISSGPDEGGYYHELFLRGRPKLCLHMRRVGIPTLLPTGEVISRRDQRRGRKSFLGMDPDFYAMKDVTIHPEEKPDDEDDGSEKDGGDKDAEEKQEDGEEQEGEKKEEEETKEDEASASGKSDSPSGGAEVEV